MCLSLACPSVPAQSSSPQKPAPKRPTARQAYEAGQLHGDQRILHALNRFTFGPRPGDLEIVRSMGLDAWFDQQLHPDLIDQSDLDARLAQYPAMQGNPQDLLYYLPSNAMIRQAIDGKVPVPDKPALHAIYENQIARVEEKRKQKDQEKQQLASTANQPPMPGQAMSPAGAMDGTSTPKAALPAEQPTDQIQPQAQPQTMQAPSAETVSMNIANVMDKPDQPSIDPALIVNILALPPDRRVARLAGMKQPEFDAFRKALKGPQRNALVTGLNPAQKELVAALENPQRLIVDELNSQRLVRDIYSNTQLEEVMTDFWLNHFNVYLHKNDETPYYMVSYERDVIRPRALGKFEDLLEATAHSPAMLLYLDNSSSIGPNSPAADAPRNAPRVTPTPRGSP